MSNFIPRSKVYDECERQVIERAKSLVNLKSAKAKIKKAEESGEKIVLTSAELEEVIRSINFNMEIEK